jgi:hypothetical protein
VHKAMGQPTVASSSKLPTHQQSASECCAAMCSAGSRCVCPVAPGQWATQLWASSRCAWLVGSRLSPGWPDVVRAERGLAEPLGGAGLGPDAPADLQVTGSRGRAVIQGTHVRQMFKKSQWSASWP